MQGTSYYKCKDKIHSNRLVNVDFHLFTCRLLTCLTANKHEVWHLISLHCLSGQEFEKASCDWLFEWLQYSNFALLGVGYEICLHSFIAVLQNLKHEKEKQGEKRENVVNVSVWVVWRVLSKKQPLIQGIIKSAEIQIIFQNAAKYCAICSAVEMRSDRITIDGTDWDGILWDVDMTSGERGRNGIG